MLKEDSLSKEKALLMFSFVACLCLTIYIFTESCHEQGSPIFSLNITLTLSCIQLSFTAWIGLLSCEILDIFLQGDNLCYMFQQILETQM